MSIELDFFPVLNGNHLERIGFEATPYRFSYFYEGESRELKADPTEKHGYKSEYLNIVDEMSEWVPDYYDLFFNRSYVINNPVFLFGPNGLACRNAEIGLALLWTSKTSNQRGVEVIESFRNDRKPVSVRHHFKFGQGRMKGNLSFRTVLFIKDPGVPDSDEQHLAGSSGMIVGTLDEYVIYLDGSGSAFPIVEVREPSQPLWWVSCDWADPLTDAFEEENVKICINKAHANYKFLNAEGGMNNSPLFKEILSGALGIIIQKAKSSDYWEDIMSGNYVETGSVAQAIKYFIDTFEWEVNSPEKLALSIRADLDVRI